ncbi:MAG: hypothetical protein AAFP04_09205 [Myxococcota bacterium]
MSKRATCSHLPDGQKLLEAVWFGYRDSAWWANNARRRSRWSWFTDPSRTTCVGIDGHLPSRFDAFRDRPGEPVLNVCGRGLFSEFVF